MSDMTVAKKMLGLVEVYGLDGESFVEGFSLEQLAKDYNGIGPEWFPSNLRSAIDTLEEELQPAAFVHDVRWSHSDGSYTWFKKSNQEFKRNGYKIAKALWPWYSPMRYLRMNKARVFGNLCQTFGWMAYKAAYEKSQRGN